MEIISLPNLYFMEHIALSYAFMLEYEKTL